MIYCKTSTIPSIPKHCFVLCYQVSHFNFRVFFYLELDRVFLSCSRDKYIRSKNMNPMFLYHYHNVKMNTMFSRVSNKWTADFYLEMWVKVTGCYSDDSPWFASTGFQTFMNAVYFARPSTTVYITLDNTNNFTVPVSLIFPFHLFNVLYSGKNLSLTISFPPPPPF